MHPWCALPTMPTNKCKYFVMIKGTFEDWGNIDFESAWEKQNALFQAGIRQRKTGEDQGFKDSLILCEHPHVFTLGLNAGRENLLVSDEELAKQGIQYVKTNRGGNITYHGPGQIVAYPVIDLKKQGFYVKDYIWHLEEVIIRVLSDFGITGTRLVNAPGVWTDMQAHGKTRKIAAVGVRASRFITMHGFALNVNTDMRYFEMIKPCGFTNEAVCSMQEISGHNHQMEEVKSRIKTHFSAVFRMGF